MVNNGTHDHKGLWVDIRYKIADISMVVMCNASDVIDYDRGTSELSNAPLMPHYIICHQNSIEQ